MHSVLQPAHTLVSQPHNRPILDSYDSGEEFSFHHWVEVRKLVDSEGDGTPSDLEVRRKPTRPATVQHRTAKHA